MNDMNNTDNEDDYINELERHFALTQFYISSIQNMLDDFQGYLNKQCILTTRKTPQELREEMFERVEKRRELPDNVRQIDVHEE